MDIDGSLQVEGSFIIGMLSAAHIVMGMEEKNKALQVIL